MRRSQHQDGFVFPFVALAMAGSIAAFYLLAIVTSELTQASQAQTAADAAALAGAADGRAGARDAAEENGARLVGFDRHIHGGEVANAIVNGVALGRGKPTGATKAGNDIADNEERDVTVTVRIGNHEAQARAQSGQLIE